jgi:uncharacterized protein
MDQPDAPRRPEYGASRMEPGVSAAQRRELRAAGGGVPWLVEHLMAGGGHLVTADDHRVRMPFGDFFGLGHGQTHSPVAGSLARDVLLAQPGTHGLEREAETLQEDAAVGRGRGEDQRVHVEAKQRLRSRKDFDLDTLDTYYTRPMSSPRSKMQAHVGLDVDRLSEAEADIDFAVSLAELPRLRAQLANVAGEVHGRVHFRRVAGIAIAELTLSGTAHLLCQRCLGALDVRVEADTRVGLIAAEADMNRVPEEFEPVLAPDGRISVGELVEEELLLTLPIVPLHADTDGGVTCVAADAPPLATDGREEEKTQRPFEQLAELLKRK